MKQFLLAIALFAFLSASAQPQTSGWLASFNTFRINSKKSIHADVQLRGTDEMEHVQTLLIRTGINFHLNKQFILTGGYAYISNRTAAAGVTGYAAEHRLWEQLIFNHKLNRIMVQHRVRLEQRFLPVVSVDGGELKTDDRVFATRARYFIRNIVPFRKQESFRKGLFASVQDEIFFNVTGTDKVNGKVFDQNRLLLGIGYRLNAAFDLEAGYMNQYISRRGDAFSNNHIIQLGGYLRL